MRNLFLSWIASAAALMIVAYIVPGFHVTGIVAALIAAVVIGLVNGTLGAILKLLAFPIGCLTFGLAYLVINALMVWLASSFVDGFHIDGFVPAFIGAVLLSLVNWMVRTALKPLEKNKG
jgi:putative membrane protein